ncbi:MAG: M14 family metallopeptidase [Candidatus Cryosericum sp.]
MTTRIPKDYVASRQRFRSRLADIRRLWPQAILTAHPVPDPDSADLSIDTLHAPAIGTPNHLLLVTAGEHGIECFAGSAILDLLIEQIIPMLNPVDTSLCLVHCINPWGMAHEQRTNAGNVDLNRNFILDWDAVERHNPQYHQLQSLFQPQGPVPQVTKDRIRTTGRVLHLALTGKTKLLNQALLAGQYDEPRGVYYGGTDWQPETRTMRMLYDDCLRSAPHVVHIDLHTGYGPRDLMSVVNSGFDPIPSAEWKRRIGYPRVVAATSEEFYRIEGDMIDYMYRTREKEAPGTTMYATCFEFGCLGDSLKSNLDSVWCAITSNRLRQYGAVSETVAEQVRRFWREAYCPSDPSWEQKACANALLAAKGILHDQGLTG